MVSSSWSGGSGGKYLEMGHKPVYGVEWDDI
jgi:hypothetical protein